MSRYFTRLAEMSGLKPNTHGLDTLSTTLLRERNGVPIKEKQEEDNFASSFQVKKNSEIDDEIGYGMSKRKQSLHNETFSQINKKHKNMATNYSTNRRNDTSPNHSFIRETAVDGFTSEANLFSAITKGKDVRSSRSSSRNSAEDRNSVFMRNKDKDRLHGSEFKVDEKLSVLPSLLSSISNPAEEDCHVRRSSV